MSDVMVVCRNNAGRSHLAHAFFERLARSGQTMSAALPPLRRRLLAEFLGAAFLAAVVIGSGIAAQRLSPHDTGLELLENATATGLFAIILMFGPVSGGHFNPVVSLVECPLRRHQLA